MPRDRNTCSITVGRVGVLVRHDPVAAGDQGHVDPGGEVGAGELGAGDAGARPRSGAPAARAGRRPRAR